MVLLDSEYQCLNVVYFTCVIFQFAAVFVFLFYLKIQFIRNNPLVALHFRTLTKIMGFSFLSVCFFNCSVSYLIRKTYFRESFSNSFKPR